MRKRGPVVILCCAIDCSVTERYAIIIYILFLDSFIFIYCSFHVVLVCFLFRNNLVQVIWFIFMMLLLLVKMRVQSLGA